jgi:SAM-dependent methyltransferase
VSRIVAGAVPSPNIWKHPAVYETENHAVDPDGVVEAEMRALRPWAGATLLDVGCGTGFHLPRFAAEADRVIGVEPHADLVELARRRTRGLANVAVRHGSAQRLPVADRSVDIMHARWAYYFDHRCEPGLRELDRVMRPGGLAVVVDNDATTSTFGRWFSRAYPEYDAEAVDRFFSRQGWGCLRRQIRWEFGSRADLEAVVRIEFPPAQADLVLGEHSGTSVDYAIVLRTRIF